MSKHPTHRQRDAGFTLPEYLIAIVLSATIAAVIGLTISVSLRTLPGTTDRADSGVAVQGITTWLPPDVDSTEPGAMDTAPSTPSGCTGTDPGINLLHLTWTETFAGVTTDYVANYRYVVNGPVGQIKRVSCSGVFTLGSRSVLDMSAKLSSTLPTVTTFDADGDSLDDQVTFSIETLAGDTVYIDAASKNPHETLPPASTYPTTTTSAPPNNPPTAQKTDVTANPSAPITFTLNASDPDGDPLTVTHNIPVTWTPIVSGITITVTPPATTGTYQFDYEVEDPSGATDHDDIEIEVVSTPTTTTTSTTTTTTTTTAPPCVVSSISVSPSTVRLKFNDPSKLREDVDVEITLGGGYCVGLTLQYDTGAPNSQYVQNFGNTPPYNVTLKGHPQGTELWAVGTHTLEVRDGGDNLLTTANLNVIPK